VNPLGFLLILIYAAIPAGVGAFILYWVIRLSVRHALEDSDRRRDQRAREEQAWDTARR
jgi:hypothetical protein